MKLYDRNIIVNILEAKLLSTFEDYCPQGEYNNKFIQYLYKYIRLNTYTGEHDSLLRQFVNLQLNDPDFAKTSVVESTDRKTYTLTDDKGFSTSMQTKINNIVKEYYNYNYIVLSENRIVVKVNFGWLPQNTSSWLNLLNDECLIDYYIDGITLRKNTHSTLGHNRPDSGYVCYLITDMKEYDTLMFLANKKKMEIEGLTLPKYKVASLLTELKGTKGATLNRIAEFDLDNFFYEIGPYNQNYLSTEKSSIVIQVPYEYALGEYYYLYDVSNSVRINNQNNTQNPNALENFFVTFSDENFDTRFTKYKLKDKHKIADKIFNSSETLDTILQQYLFGDFIWKTSDSKLIAFAQNLVNYLFGNSQLVPNGVWSDELSVLVTRYKTGSEASLLLDDDVIDMITEEAMVNEFKNITGLDPNEELFNEW